MTAKTLSAVAATTKPSATATTPSTVIAITI